MTDTEDVGPAAKASGGSSLFDIGADEPEAKQEPEPTPVEPVETKQSGGSLFDIGTDEPEAAEPEAEAKATASPTPAEPVESQVVRWLALRHRGPANPRPEAANRNQRRSSLSRPRPTPSSPRRDPRGRLPLRHRSPRARGEAGTGTRAEASRNQRRSSLSRPRPSQQPASRDPLRRVTLRHRGPRTRGEAEPNPTPVEPVETRTRPTPGPTRRPATGRRRAQLGRRAQPGSDRRCGRRLRAGARQRTRTHVGRACRDPRRDRGHRRDRRGRRGARAGRRGRQAGGEAQAGQQRRGSPAEDRRRHQRVELALRPLTEGPRPTAVVPWTEDGSGHGLPGVRRGAPDVAGPGRRAARCRGDRRAPRWSATSC